MPVTALHPLADQALQRHAPSAQRVQVGASPYAYGSLLASLWSQGVDFLLVEHDIEIHAGVLPSLAACDEPWCLFPYPGAGDQGGNRLVDHALGCTRFAGTLLRAEPRAVPAPGVHWAQLDCRLHRALCARGYRPHVHLPPVAHHHQRAGRCDCGAPGHAEEPA